MEILEQVVRHGPLVAITAAWGAVCIQQFVQDVFNTREGNK